MMNGIGSKIKKIMSGSRNFLNALEHYYPMIVFVCGSAGGIALGVRTFQAEMRRFPCNSEMAYFAAGTMTFVGTASCAILPPLTVVFVTCAILELSLYKKKH